jgi:predicted ATPase/DNA-binding winged helix-turn-helix (wHTH) protein
MTIARTRHEILRGSFPWSRSPPGGRLEICRIVGIALRRTLEPEIREQVLKFGPYLLFPSQRLLRAGEKNIRLGNRAFDLLLALVERAGEIVTREELLGYAWPKTVVEENNLRVHIAAIRKILGNGDGGARYIVNVAGRGYKFIAAVSRADPADPRAAFQPRKQSVLPEPLTRILGREEAIKALIAQVPGSRLVTIVGTGGVGKTTVGLAVAEELGERYERVCFVDLSAVDDPGLVPSVLATVLGISGLMDDPVASLKAYLRDKSILIVLDNCEHVIGRAAEVAEQILRAAADVDILATSREPLSAQGEHIRYLAPLRCPPDTGQPIVADALSFPAVQLFVERAANASEGFELTESNVAAVAAICRRLDGIPFAIELVAARINVFGAQTIAEGFGDDLLLATRGRRTARSRHQSLRATLAWSYRTLAPFEQITLSRLSVFRGFFSFECAAAVISDDVLSTARVLDALTSLVAKCLLSTDLGGHSIGYRLLYTTRAYAAEQLRESNERAEMSYSHARHYYRLLEGALESWETLTRQEWLVQYGSLINDVRAALEWAFAPGGDTELGAALTVASLPFGVQLSLLDEFKNRATLALEALSRLSPPRPLWELRINNALVGLLWNTGGSEDVLLQTVNRALVLAGQIGTPRYSIDPYANRALLFTTRGDYAVAVEAVDALDRLATELADATAILVSDRVGAQIHHYAGNLVKARVLTERVLSQPSAAVPLIYNQVPIDRQISMRIILARNLWLEGFADQAQKLAMEAIKLAASDGPLAMSHALGLAACPIAFWRGDLVTAARLTDKLLEHSRRHTFGHWINIGLCYQQSLDSRQGCLQGGEDGPLLATVAPEGPFDRDALCTTSDSWLDPPTIDRAARGLCGWALPEVLRLAGTMHLRGGRSDAQAAQIDYRRSLGIAREKQSLAWELRTATSLAHLLCSQGRRTQALETVQSVYGRFTEGFETADLKAARGLIEKLTAEI